MKNIATPKPAMVPACLLALILTLSLAAAALAAPESPSQTLEVNVDKVITVLKDPRYADGAHREEQLQILRALADRMFDWVELSKRCLARHWNEFTTDQKRAFVPLFADLLERTYRDRISGYSGQEVRIDREIMLTDTKAEVQTTVISRDKEIAVAYRMTLNKGVWRVYDVKAEDISLVNNYRKQFDDLLSKNTPDEMIKILKEKVESGEVSEPQG